MKKRVLGIIVIFSFLLLGCNKIPDVVKNYNHVVDLTPFTEIKKSDNKTKNITIDNKLCIDSHISIPNNDVIQSYEMKPMEYNEDNVFHWFNMNKADYKLIQGGLTDIYDKNYEPVAYQNNTHCFFIDNKNGKFDFCNLRVYEEFTKMDNEMNNEIPLEKGNCAIPLDQAKDMIDEVMKQLMVEYTIDDIKVYRDNGEDYYSFKMSQMIEGMRVDDEDNSFSSEDNSIERHYIDVLINGAGFVLFHARLCSIEQPYQSYHELISLDSALEIIKTKIDFILPSGNVYNKKDGKVTINKIELIYIPQRIDSSNFHYKMMPVWLFQSGSNINTNSNCNIRINALTGELM